MRVLMITQRVDRDDAVLGFTHAWIQQLAARVERLIVVALDVGPTELPDNVTLRAMRPKPPAGRLTRWLSLNRALFESVRQADVVFVHMIPRWVIAAAPYCAVWRAPIVLWYTHRQVTWQLRIAHRLVKRVVTASPESYGLHDGKVTIIGHGIDTDLFAPAADMPAAPHNVIAVGRLSPIKNYETLVRAAHILVRERGQTGWRFTIVGEAAATAPQYERTLRALVSELEMQQHIDFAGSISNRLMPELYRSYFVSVNLSPTGGMDKAVLESLACGTPALVCNRTFEALFDRQGSQLMLHENDPLDLADHLEKLAALTAADRASLCKPLRDRVVVEYSIGTLTTRLATLLEECVRGP